MLGPAFEKLSLLNKIRQREIVAPIAKKQLIVSPLLVSDDLALKTSITSPGLYEEQLSQVIYSKLTFPNNEKISYDEFISSFSDIDKLIILWGILDSTYEIYAADTTITCPKCKLQFKDTIKYEDLIDEDSFKVWDKELPFTEYAYPVQIDINSDSIKHIIFNVCLPTIKRKISLYRMIGIDELKLNYEKTGEMTSMAGTLAGLTREIVIVDNNNNEERISNLQEIYIAYNSYISHAFTDKINDDYIKEFADYFPKFRKKYNCSGCGADFDIPVNIEVNLYSKFFRV